MCPKTKYITFIALLLTSLPRVGYGQADTLPNLPTDKLPRPSISAGFGTLTYFGDVGHLNGLSRTAQLNWGYHVAINNPISNSLSLDFYALFGKMAHMERLRGQGANFQTEVRMGGASLSYNFDQFLPKDRLISPYLSVGISTFEYNPKSDLKDANGNWYHMWDDGTLRDLPQADKNAGSAGQVVRDYTYETDLRSLNGEESTQQLRSLALPIGAGAHIVVNEKFNLALGATYHFTFTDDLDGVNSENLESGKGLKGNDRFLYASIGLAYNLHYDKRNKQSIEGLSKGDQMALAREDEDADGVPDLFDLCPFTPASTQVDIYGCPLDADKDGVADHVDLEPNSAAGAVVNAEGVTMTDADFEKIYLVYIDSLGHQQYDKSKKYTEDVARNGLKIGDRSKGYRIMLNDGDMSNTDISKLLSVADLRSRDTPDGTEYYVGDFDSMEDAVQRLLKLDREGIATSLVYHEYGKMTKVADKEIEEAAKGTIDNGDDSNKVTFRVQIGAYRYKLPAGVFKEVPDVLVLEGKDGLIRYVSGSFDNIKAGAEHKIELLLKGYEGAFVSAYKGGKRITLKEAGATVNAKEDITSSGPSGKLNKDFVKFTVQLGSFNGRVPAETLNAYMSLNKVRPIRAENGVTRYIYGSFDSLDEAEKALEEIRIQNFTGAMVLGEFNGQLIDAQEAQKIKTQ